MGADPGYGYNTSAVRLAPQAEMIGAQRSFVLMGLNCASCAAKIEDQVKRLRGFSLPLLILPRRGLLSVHTISGIWMKSQERQLMLSSE